MKDLNRTMLRSILLASAAAGACLSIPTIAAAAPAPAAAANVDVGEIVVTGSRIRRDTFDTPLPMASVNSDQIRQSGNVVLGDIINDLPQIDIASTSQNTSSTLFQSGQARVDIRGLGPNRTLVLMDGRRIINSDTSSPAVDLNTIPALMIDRIDVLPGGQSAVYGSEAIAGVVNLIMKKSFEGFQLDIQGGTTQHWDGQQSTIGVLYGRHFADDRGSFVVGAEYGKEEPIFQKDRADEGLFPGIRRNSAVGVVTQGILPASRSSTSPFATFEIRPDVGVSLANPFGTNNPVAATIDVRDPTQVVRLSPACSLRTVNPTCQDPSLFYSAVYNALQNKTMRGTVRAYADFKLTDHIKAFADLSEARVDGYGYFQPAFSSTAGGGTLPVSLKGDNAFLQGSTTADQQLRALITGAGLTVGPGSTTSINVGKFWGEFGRRDVYTRRHVERAVIGMNGDFDWLGRNFAWDWYGEIGILTGHTDSFGVPNIQKTQFATDAVLGPGGVPVCRAVLQGNPAAAGCVPWDLINGPSAGAIGYANGEAFSTQVGRQNVVAGNITFDAIHLPAGPLGVALGVEHREEKSSFVQDPISATGALFFNAVGTRAGKFEVTEGYFEARVPILKDMPFAKRLDLEYAIRAANYSTIHATSQYRLEGNWTPVDDIRFRVSKATAVRAPNIVELFSPQGRNFTTAAVDPCDATIFAGATAAQQAARRVNCAAAIPGWNPATFQSNFGPGRPSLALLQGGNPQLGPETALTFDYGAVIKPRWIPNLQISVDYFKYNISNVVGLIPINTLFQNLCYDATTPYASNPFCTLIQRDQTGTNGGSVPGGVIQAILTNQNIAKRKVSGYDYSAAYRFDVGDVLHGHDWGTIGLRIDATWTYRWQIQGLPGQAYTQLANALDNGTPRWKGIGTLNWTYDKLSLNWTTHYIGSLRSNSAFQPNQLDPYYTGDWWMHDLRGNYKLNDKLDLRAGILNITNEYPPYIPEAFAGTGAGSSMYDNRGRFFYVGASLRY